MWFRVLADSCHADWLKMVASLSITHILATRQSGRCRSDAKRTRILPHVPTQHCNTVLCSQLWDDKKNIDFDNKYCKMEKTGNLQKRTLKLRVHLCSTSQRKDQTVGAFSIKTAFSYLFTTALWTGVSNKRWYIKVQLCLRKLLCPYLCVSAQHRGATAAWVESKGTLMLLRLMLMVRPVALLCMRPPWH